MLMNASLACFHDAQTVAAKCQSTLSWRRDAMMIGKRKRGGVGHASLALQAAMKNFYARFVKK